MKLEFLGTGAADWFAPDPSGEVRRMTSTLFDGRLLIDMMEHALERRAALDAVTDVLITHSHRDHYNPEAIARIAPVNLYVDAGWADAVRIPGVAVHPVREGEPFRAAGFEVVGMHGNHSTEGDGEHTVHYLLQKDGRNVYYCTDGAWILYREMCLIRDNPLDALVIDSTIGDGHAGDYRVFEHNSLPMVRIMVESLQRTGMLKPGAPVFLTHLARTLHEAQAALEAQNPPPYVVCRDGLTAEI